MSVGAGVEGAATVVRIDLGMLSAGFGPAELGGLVAVDGAAERRRQLRGGRPGEAHASTQKLLVTNLRSGRFARRFAVLSLISARLS